MLREFQEEIKRLKMQLENQGGEDGNVIVKEVEEIHEIEEIEEIEAEEEDEGANEDEHDEEEEPGSKKEKKIKSKKLKKAASKKSLDDSKAEAAKEDAETQARVQALKAQLEQETKAILETKGIEESEKNRLITEAEKRIKEVEEERKRKEEAAKKLAQLEQKLLVGGVNLLDKSEEQKLLLAKKAQELEEKARKERELQRSLQEQEETHLQIEEEFTSLQDEATAKTKKLKKLWNVLMRHRAEIKDLHEENQREREALLETIRDLTKELKYKLLILDSFISMEDQGLIESFAEFDESSEKWRIAYIAHAGNNIRGKRDLVSGKVLKQFQGVAGKILGSKRSGNKDDDGHNRTEPPWDPLCVFSNPYLSYDSSKSGSGSKTRRKPSSKSSRSGSPTKKSAPSSPRKTGASSPTKESSQSLEEPAQEAIPQARGLVGRRRHYA
jgi:kinesin family protein 3/17